MSVHLENRNVVVDGRPTFLFSGEIQNYRLPPGQWLDRLEKLRAAGLNCVGTYIGWNFHSPSRDTVDFESPDCDVGRFLDLAAQAGLYVIARPGPYVCNEWDLGGYPGWLLDEDGGDWRTGDPKHLAWCRSWYEGRVTIKRDQSVFKALAGRSFSDAGRSMDYIGGNHDILGVELDPGPDCEVLATYENGGPAIVRRRLGGGAVITLGSAFWRDSRDRMGIWWPEEIETDFLADLLEGVGFEPPVCSTDDRLVWAQPYRSNNGLDSVAVLVSWRDDRDVDVEVRLRLPERPRAVVSHGVDGVKELAFDWAEGVARVEVHMPAKEVKVLSAEVHSPFSGVTHWWDYQQRFWHELDEPRIDFTPYTKGKWKDPTLDLRFGARFTNADPGRADWTAAPFNDADWKPCRLGVLSLQGAAESEPAWVRKRFTVPPEWSAEGGSIYLVSGSWGGPHYLGETRMILNGTTLHDYTTSTYNETDVTRLLGDGENVLAFQLRGGRKHLGFTGNVYLFHRRPAARSVDLSGPWQGKDGSAKSISLRLPGLRSGTGGAGRKLPGKGEIKAPTRMVGVPASWRGRYRVRLYMEGDRSSVLGAWVNGRLVRRHHHSFGPRCDVDITNMLRFGEENEIVLAHGHEWKGMDLRADQVPSWDVREIRLDAFADTSPSISSAARAR